jgi:hypothetical protein
MDVIKVPDRPASQAFYSVAGRLLFVETHDQQLRSPIELLFAGWQLTPVSFSDKSPDIHINFASCAQVPEVPSDCSQFEIADGGQCYTHGESFYLTLQSSLVHLGKNEPVTVNVWLSELPGPGDPLLARVASFAVCAALRRFGLFDLHSAGVVSPASGKGVLIVGRSGSGKSTLALRLAMSDWPYLSDDELLLSLVDGEIEARGFRSFFAVSTSQSSSFKTCFEPELVVGSQRRQSATPGVLLFTCLSGERQSQLSKLTQAETMTRLIRACPWATYDTSIAGANLEILSALARQTKAFDLFAGLDLLQPKYASDLLLNL